MTEVPYLIICATLYFVCFYFTAGFPIASSISGQFYLQMICESWFALKLPAVSNISSSLRVFVHLNRSGHCSIRSQRVFRRRYESNFDWSRTGRLLWCRCSLRPDATVLALLALLPWSLHLSCGWPFGRGAVGRPGPVWGFWIRHILRPIWTNMRWIHGRLSLFSSWLPIGLQLYWDLFVLSVLHWSWLCEGLQHSREVLRMERCKFRTLFPLSMPSLTFLQTGITALFCISSYAVVFLMMKLRSKKTKSARSE